MIDRLKMVNDSILEEINKLAEEQERTAAIIEKLWQTQQIVEGQIRERDKEAKDKDSE